MKKIMVFTPIFIAFALIVSAVTPQIAMSEKISENVLRLHIIANSDSLSDQELKLKVRDKILEISPQIYNNCNNVGDAVASSVDNLSEIRKAAQSTLAFYDNTDEVVVTVCKEFFKTRKYNGFVLPAGVYNTVKVVIGQGKGHNWWCVMFPTVCISGCTDDFDKSLTPEERKMIESKGFAVRFKVVEVYERLKNTAKDSGK